MSTRRFVGPDRPFDAVVDIPGDKSLSHRALLLGSMGSVRSQVGNLGPGLDVVATSSALAAVGAALDGPGVEGWTPPPEPIDCGNSGTTMRLLAGALSARPFDSVLVGDTSLMRRPMERLVAPLRALGAEIETTGGTAPLTVRGRPLTGARVVVEMPSAQVRSAVAFAALQAAGSTQIDSPGGFRDHTERWLESLGLGRRLGPTGFEVIPGPVPPLDVTLPGDPSSAAFLWAAAAITPGARVTTPAVSLNPGRVGFLHTLRAMGAHIDWEERSEVLGDPVGDVTVANAPLRGIHLGAPEVVSCIDEVPLVAVVAAFASGNTAIGDAAELRVKESDRIAATVAMVRALGGDAEERPDGLVVRGRPLVGGFVDAGGDHRIAMAGAVAAAGAGIVDVAGFEAADVSWPGFAAVLEDVWS